MIAVVSQCWSLDGGDHAVAYEDRYQEFLDFHRQHAGFRGRQLLRGIDDPTHFTNLRFFDSVTAYEELIQIPGYAEHIAALSEHLDLTRILPKEYVELVVQDGPVGYQPLT